jgi:hypothetical protein
MPGETVMIRHRALWLIVTVSFAASLAVSAVAATKSAATKTKRVKPTRPAASTASTCRGANLFHCGPLYNSTDYLGTDPDPFIRLMIQRDLGAKYGGES